MFYHHSPWVEQYLNEIDSSGTDIPCQDLSAYVLLPQYRWLFNKLNICEVQNIKAFPHGIVPSKFPIFSKPIINLEGMSIGATTLTDWKPEYYKPGHFWMPLLRGKQYSTDVAICGGKLVWSYSFYPKISDKSFSSWHGRKTPQRLLQLFKRWVKTHFTKYNGICNFETIGDTIIECHPRMSTQFIDLNGYQWLEKVVKLYKHSIWDDHTTVIDGHSVVLRAKKGGIYKYNPFIIDSIAKQVSSIQMTFANNSDVRKDVGNNDDYTYRLAIINGFDLGICQTALQEVKEHLKIS